MKSKFAVVETGGKQYLVKPGSIVRVERLEQPKNGDSIHFDKVLLLKGEGEIKLGDSYIKAAKIDGKLLKEGRYKKITNLRYHSKTRYTKKHGHRQVFSEVAIGEF